LIGWECPGCPDLKLSNRPVRTRMPGGVAGVPLLLGAPYADGAPGTGARLGVDGEMGQARAIRSKSQAQSADSSTQGAVHSACPSPVIMNKISLHTRTFAALALAGLASVGHAAQPLITDDTGTQGAGGHQVEAAYTHERARQAGSTDRSDAVPLTYTYGLNETLDAYLGLVHVNQRPAGGGRVRGFSNPTVGLKWRVFEHEASQTSVALKPELLLPVSAANEAKGLGVGEASGGLTLIVSQELPFGAVHFNAAVGRERYRDAAVSPDVASRRLSVAPVWNLSEAWKLALDLGQTWERSGGQTVRVRHQELGAIYSPSKDLDWAAGWIRTHDDASPKTVTHTFVLGLTARF
jgi:Putative MetA-pathway of phenol degradation